MAWRRRVMGGGGGGKGGGGRAGRSAGGGGSAEITDAEFEAALQDTVLNGQGAETPYEIDKAIADMGYYKSEAEQIVAEKALVNSKALQDQYGTLTQKGIKTPAEMGLKVEGGKVIPSEVGAPQLPAKLMSESDAVAHLAKVGFNDAGIFGLEQAGSLREVATLIPKGSKVLGSPGADAIGVDIGGGKVLRVQYSSTLEPLKTSDIGRNGIYPEWAKKYGGTWVEQKRKVEVLANKLPEAERARALATLKQNIRADHPNIGLKEADLHGGNWGVFRNADGTTTPVIFDPGAAPFKGAKITAEGWGN
jgi:hypothetical protein